MDHLEAIVEIKKIVNPDLCDEVITIIDEKATKHLTIEEDELNKNIRNVLGYTLDSKKDKFIFDKIKKEIEKLHLFYKVKFPKIDNTKTNQIDILKYKIGGQYKYHVDTYTDFTRSLSVIMNLNNNYEGGDLVFGDQKNFEVKRLKLDKGSIVFFPSNFMYPHGIEPITKGTRYSIVSWLQ